MNIYLCIIIVLIFFLLYTLKVLQKKRKNQLVKICSVCLILMSIWCFLLATQIIVIKKLDIEPIIFEYIIYIPVSLLPLTIFFLGRIYTNTSIKFKKYYLFYLIFPIITMIILWTNNIHHLFYKHYSIYINKTEFGSFFYIYSIYQYLFTVLGIIYLLKFSIKNSGFFSRQSLLIVLGILIPVIANILGTFKVISMTIYITPICFSLTVLLLAIAIFKYDFLEVSPIALQKIVDRISDSYIVINNSNIITDFNKTFLTTFELKESEIRKKNIIDFLKKSEYKINFKKFSNNIKKAYTTSKTQKFNETFAKIEKTFTIEISDIVSQDKYQGCIILFKDITQHIQDMETIKNNQEMLIERERLASLGQMIGGISHNLKTPIFSIAGGLEAINDLVSEYKASIDSPQVTKEDMYAIGNDIEEWIDKLKGHLEYMSDIITAVKGQAVAFSENSIGSFDISEVFKHVEILMKHDLKHSFINLYTTNEVPENINLTGNMNGLVQVIDNLVANAIYAYKSMGKTDQAIDLSAKYIEATNNIEIRVKDYGPGLPKEVQQKLFKEMITTKGKEGTGLGLFMSASNIKAQFKGTLSYETAEGKGTTFIISLPILTVEANQ